MQIAGKIAKSDPKATVMKRINGQFPVPFSPPLFQQGPIPASQSNTKVHPLSNAPKTVKVKRADRNDWNAAGPDDVLSTATAFEAPHKALLQVWTAETDWICRVLSDYERATPSRAIVCERCGCSCPSSVMSSTRAVVYVLVAWCALGACEAFAPLARPHALRTRLQLPRSSPSAVFSAQRQEVSTGKELSDTDARVLESLLQDDDFLDYLQARNMSLSKEDIADRRAAAPPPPPPPPPPPSEYKSETLKTAAAIQSGAEELMLKMRMAAGNFGKYVVSKIVADSQVALTVVATAAARAVLATSQVLLPPASASQQKLLGNSSSFDAAQAFGGNPFSDAGSGNFSLKETLDLLQTGALDAGRGGPSKPLRSFETYRERQRSGWVPRLRPKMVPDAVNIAVDAAKAPGDLLMGGARAANSLVDLAYTAQKEIKYDQAGTRVNKYLGKAGLGGLPLDEISRLGEVDEEEPGQLAGDAPKSLASEVESARAVQAKVGPPEVGPPEVVKMEAVGTETVGTKTVETETVETETVETKVVQSEASPTEPARSRRQAASQPAEFVEATVVPSQPRRPRRSMSSKEFEALSARPVESVVGAAEAVAEVVDVAVTATAVEAKKVADAETDAETDASAEASADANTNGEVVTTIDVDTGEVTIESTITETEEDPADAKKDNAALAGPLIRLSLRSLDILLLLVERSAVVAFRGANKLGVAVDRASAALEWKERPSWPRKGVQRQAPLLTFLEKSRVMRMNDIEGLRRRAKAKAEREALQAGSNLPQGAPMLGPATPLSAETGQAATMGEPDLEIDRQLVP
eukprot:scaffold268_cov236-Pinguiococcus_pyrenoidosus.AAC.6